MLFFAEGTFTRMPGLLPFHMGAFAAAVEAGVPVVPVALRGTRSILRSDVWYAHRGKVSVEVAEPVSPDGSDFQATARLRDSVRAVLLARLGEPDLAAFVPAAPGGAPR